MNIKGINNLSGINYYNKISSTKVNKAEKEKSVDRIEISERSKALLEYTIDNNYDSKGKINNIKNEISNGTYSYDAKLIAKSILDAMRGKE